MGIMCEVMNLLQWITESGIKWPNSNPGIYTRRRAHGGALAFRSLWRPRNTPISLHYHRRSLLGSITWQNRDRNKVGFCMKSGTKNMRSHCKFPELLWQHILLFNKLDGLARNPAFNASPHLGGQISTKGDLPSDQQSFLDNPVIPPCLCAWDVIRNPGLGQPNIRGRKKTSKGGLSRGGKNFFSFFKKNRVPITRVSAENDLVRRSQVLHCAESDCVRRGRVSTHVQHRAHWKNVRCGFLLPISRSPPEHFGVSYFSVLTKRVQLWQEVPCCGNDQSWV